MKRRPCTVHFEGHHCFCATNVSYEKYCCGCGLTEAQCTEPMMEEFKDDGSEENLYR